ncbi:hypothetical protein DK419_15515 [Methylobacterium terrae]|uniref:Uncharacterized protein n=1 Tax=Methylobacterium terrae TaxID=2202827 RepID=A0A2U8WQ18_9HYPH|nr:hypothetical protein DK419_15515 [Methylobacterium terrae]
MRYSSFLFLRAEPSLAPDLTAAAHALGMSRSEFVRCALRTAIENGADMKSNAPPNFAVESRKCVKVTRGGCATALTDASKKRRRVGTQGRVVRAPAPRDQVA